MKMPRTGVQEAELPREKANTGIGVLLQPLRQGRNIEAVFFRKEQQSRAPGRNLRKGPDPGAVTGDDTGTVWIFAASPRQGCTHAEPQQIHFFILRPQRIHLLTDAAVRIQPDLFIKVWIGILRFIIAEHPAIVKVRTEHSKPQLFIFLPLGIHISGAAERTPGMKKLADIRWAAYTVTVTGAPLDAQQIEAFMERADVIVEKKTKRKTTEADILPDIANLALSCAEADGAVLSMILSAGPSANLKPELVVSAMEQYIPGFFVTDVDIHRTKILADDGRALM